MIWKTSFKYNGYDVPTRGLSVNTYASAWELRLSLIALKSLTGLKVNLQLTKKKVEPPWKFL